MSADVVILVYSTSHAIQAERVLAAAGIRAKLVPTPRQLSSDCGSAVRIAGVDRERGRAALDQAGVPLDRIEALES